MKQGLLKILAIVLAVIAVAGLLWTGIHVLEKDGIRRNISRLSDYVQSLDITEKCLQKVDTFLEVTNLNRLDIRNTGMTLKQYEWLREKLPVCKELWDVPIQGIGYSEETEELHVQMLTEAEVEALKYLPDLRLVDVGNWEDYVQIQALQQKYPGCRVCYRIHIAGEWWDSDVVSLILEDADAEELCEKLKWFQRLESVMLTGSIPTQAQLQSLQKQYPDIFFLWKMELQGKSLETDMTELDLSGIPLESMEEVEQLLPYFPKTETVLLDGGAFALEELTTLVLQYPQIRFLFDLRVGDRFFHSGAEEIDLSNIALENVDAVEQMLPCFRNLKKVVMCNCGISSEDMDALNKRYENIRFVWSVELAGMAFRTDAVHFTPNRWGLSCDNDNIDDLRYCTDMVCVDIGHQIKVTNCEWVRNMPDLKYLVLAETGISDLTPLTDHKNLIFLEIFLSKVKDYSPLATCRALEDLNLCYTQGDPKPIGEMTWLKRLWWSGCWAGRKYLQDKLPDTYVECLSLSSTGRGWREGQHYYDMRDFIGMEYMVG